MQQRDFTSMIDGMSREQWAGMRKAIETGRWPDGRTLTGEQRQLCLQAVIAWEARNDVPPEQRTGPPPVDCAGSSSAAEQPVTLAGPGEKRDA